MPELKYSFPGLPIHEAIIVQEAITRRKESINLQQSEKVIKALLTELDQMYDDLNHHIAAETRMQEKVKTGERLLPQD